jgi:hypothetical protein
MFAEMSHLAASLRRTSKVIHDIGSSWGISVRFTSSSVSFSLSNCTVKMAPGGVQVPIIKWWRGMVENDVGCWCRDLFRGEILCEKLREGEGAKRSSDRTIMDRELVFDRRTIFETQVYLSVDNFFLNPPSSV